MRTITFEINREECVGDSVGKHNYNSMSLDTVVCNLSSIFFKNVDNLLTWFNDISTNSVNLINNANDFSDESVLRYNIVNTTTNILSSYWNTSEFTVQFEHNLYTPDNNLNGPSSDSIDAYASSTPLTTIINVAEKYLNINFPASSYNINTRANVVIFLYNTLNVNILSNKTYAVINNVETQISNPALALQSLDDYDVNNKGYYIANNTLKINDSYGRRSIRVDFFKENVNINNACTVKFIKIEKNWKINEVILDDKTNKKI